jgi:hypothetical protein
MDPMTEQPYVWNGDDPISNADPSGFVSGSNGGGGNSNCVFMFDGGGCYNVIRPGLPALES